MDMLLNKKIETLRQKTRSLLVDVDKNSERIQNAIAELYSESLIQPKKSVDLGIRKRLYYENDSKSWILRNNSSAVEALLHPDSSCLNLKHTSSLDNNMRPPERISIKSKQFTKQPCLENIHRKPVKGCYCQIDTKITRHQTVKEQSKGISHYDHCRHNIELRSECKNKNSEKQERLSPPVSCETLQRVQKIDYTPRSQFLRNVQSRISVLQDTVMQDALNLCPVSPCYCNKLSTKLSERIHDKSKNDAKYKAHHNSLDSSSIKDLSGEEMYPQDSQKTVSRKVVNEAGFQNQQRPRFLVKKTLTSKKTVPETITTKSSAKSNFERKLHYKSNKRECPCCKKKNEDKKLTICADTDDILNYESPNDDRESHENEEERNLRNEILNIKKFREQNYFDTHGSKEVLSSSRSSGSLQQFLLNDRLFPEPVKKIHKKDLVVTIPPCAVMQRKRVHYFPRYVVRQERNNWNETYRKKRCQSCPLTGHAIDYGVLKTQPPINSFALRYQKQYR